MPILTFVSFAFFTGLVALITWRIIHGKSDHTSDGYFLAGRSLTGGYIAGSLLLTNLSTEQLVGLNGAAFNDGISVMAWEVMAAVALVMMALFFLPKYLRSGIATIPDFLAERFNDTTRTITSLIFIVAYTAILLPIILYTGATGLAGILDLKSLTGIQSDAAILWVTVWTIGIIGSIYAIFGGLRSVAVSDTLNGFGLLIGGIMICVFGLNAISDGGMFAALRELQSAHPEKFNSLGGPKQSVPFTTLFSGVLLLGLFYWCTNQQIIQRTFGASTLKEGQKGVLIAGLFKVLAPIIMVLPGIIAFHLYASEDFKSDHAYGTLVRNVLPAPLTGFFAAVMVGAILSSFNSALNSTATLFSLGVYKHMIKHDTVDDRKVIGVGKIFGGAIAVLAMLVAPLLAGQESIFAYLQDMNGLYAIPIFSVVLMGLIHRRVPAFAANIALGGGFILIAIGYFTPTLKDWIKEELHTFHFLGLVFLSLLLFMFIMGKVKPLREPWEHRYSGHVDMTPWKWAKPFGYGLVSVVLLIFIVFADTSVVGFP